MDGGSAYQRSGPYSHYEIGSPPPVPPLAQVEPDLLPTPRHQPGPVSRAVVCRTGSATSSTGSLNAGCGGGIARTRHSSTGSLSSMTNRGRLTRNESNASTTSNTSIHRDHHSIEEVEGLEDLADVVVEEDEDELEEDLDEAGKVVLNGAESLICGAVQDLKINCGAAQGLSHLAPAGASCAGGLLEPDHSLMETSIATTSTVDSTAELVHRSHGVSYNTTTLGSSVPISSVNPPSYDPNDCGLFSFRPTQLQELANIKIFVFLLSILVMVQQALSSGYLNSVITTIEKRYEIPSSLTGVISSMYEVGNVITVLFVSYLGSKRRIPVWIGVGCLTMGIGSLVFVMPQLMSDRWDMSLEEENSTDSGNICRSASIKDDTSDHLSDIGFGTLTDLSNGVPLGSHNSIQYSQKDNCIKGSKKSIMPVVFFMVGQLLLGAGGSPLFTLGTTYIDDHVKKESSSMYIGIIYTMVAFGPVLGFLLGAYLLSYYVDSLFIDTNFLKSVNHKHHRWIGMWWGGFLICGLLLILLSFPFFMFPKTLKKEKEKVRLEEKSKEFTKGHRRTKSQTSTCSKHSTLSSKRVYGRDIRDIPYSMLKILVNPIFMVTCVGACFELIIVSGFIVFLPKYLETQFFLSNVQASIFTGGIAIPGACIGTFLGGYLLKRFSLRPKGAIQMVMVFNLMGLSVYGLLFLLGCDNVKMAGTTSPYFNHTVHMSAMGNADQKAFEVNLTAWCNMGCSCNSASVEPVCGNNGLTYFSPCHAGCSSSRNGQTNFANCSCVQGSHRSSFGGAMQSALSSSIPGKGGPSFSEVTVVPLATAGPCYIPCNTIMPFMVLLFFMCCVVAISQMPLLMIVLRSVDEEERSFALGVQFVLFRLIAYIPAPIMFGTVIDSTCLLWKSDCGEKGGRCLMYDIEAFRFRYVGICTAIKVISAAIFIFDWLLIRWKYKLDMEGTMTVGDIVNSLMSVDRNNDDDEQEELEETVWLPELQGTRHNLHAASMQINSPTQVIPSGSNVVTAQNHNPYNFVRNNSLTNKTNPYTENCTSGHKRSQSGSYTVSRPWTALCTHKRSHSSSGYQHLELGGPAPPGILATQPGHQRRASSGQQVTFRGLAHDPTDLTGVKVMVKEPNKNAEADEMDEVELSIKV